MREYDEKCGSKSQPQHQQTNRHPDDKPVKNLTRLKFQNRVYSIRGRKNLRVSLAGRKTNRSSHMREFDEKCGSKSRPQYQQTNICSVKKCTKSSSNTVMFLVHFLRNRR